MSRIIGISDNNVKVKTVRQRTIDDGKKGLLLGAAIGGIEGFTRKSWVAKDKPSDKFVKNVSKGLEATLTADEHKEFNKVKSFFKELTNYRVNLDTMRGRIEKSTELTNAISKKDGETTKDALDRIFANPDKTELANELRDLQNHTNVDKKVNIYAARDIANKNFDAKSKKLVKAEGTSDEIFRILKKSAKNINKTTAIQHTVVGAVLAGTLGLLIGANVSDKMSKTK